MLPIPRGHRFEIVPDWVCEILSSGITRKDRVVKIPIYARHGVAHLWLADPLKRTLELSLSDLWVDDEEEPTPEAEGRYPGVTTYRLTPVWKVDPQPLSTRHAHQTASDAGGPVFPP